MWRWVGVVSCLNASHLSQQLLSCRDVVRCNWAKAQPCFIEDLETMQHYSFLQVTALRALKLNGAAVAG